MMLILILCLAETYLYPRQIDGDAFITANDPSVRTVVIENINGLDNIPVAGMETGDSLILKFDIIGDSHRNLKAHLSHRNSDWTHSTLLDSEWLSGFNEFEIADYSYSSSTYVHYVNYSFPFSPSTLGIISGGNYVIDIFDEHDSGKNLLSVPFSVSENTASIAGSVSTDSDFGFNTHWQQLEIEIDTPPGLTVNPDRDLIVTVTQNNDPKTERIITKPFRMEGGKTVYARSPELIFPAGNEFRRFETVRTDYPGLNTDSVYFANESWHAVLKQDAPLCNKGYHFDSTQHGRFKIDEYNATDADLGADYVTVKFSLKMPGMTNARIHIDGDLTSHTLSEASEMVYDRMSGLYTLSIPLKQGSYNYRYVAVDNDGTVDYGFVDGNYHETSNEYLIKVYLGKPGSRGHKLIAYKVIPT